MKTESKKLFSLFGSVYAYDYVKDISEEELIYLITESASEKQKTAA